MESFFRYVSYVDYYKKSEKIKNVGFMRWKLHNEEHRLELQVKNLYGVQGTFEIEEKNTGKIIGGLCIDQGIGNYTKKFISKTASGNRYIDTLTDRLYLDEIEGFVIRLKDEEYLAVDLNLEQEGKYNNERLYEDNLKKDTQKEYIKELNSDKKEIELSQENKREGLKEYSILYEKESLEEDFLIENVRRLEEDTSLEIKEGRKILEEDTLSELKESRKILEEDKKKIEISYEKGDNIKYEQKKFLCERNKNMMLKETEAASDNILIEGIGDKYIEQSYLKEKEALERQNKKIKIIEPVHEDKWQELCRKYQKVHPFPGNKVFLSVKPEDFIVLQQDYQKLVNNSFLLHGFYNYGHMILGKLSEEDETPVYIGVPGVYYEREKQAAQMFGFAGFEGASKTIENGSYGYYMIEVKI